MKTLKVIKIGGNSIDDATSLQEFLNVFCTVKGPKILVHGGGKIVTNVSKKMQMEVTIVDGRRVTNAETLDIITMVYAGKINKNIIASLQQKGCKSVGFTGADGNTIVSKQREVKDLDYGFVGDVIKVNTSILEVLLDAGVTPVFSAITHNEKGQLLNTNADTIASELAIAFAEKYHTELYYCFEKNGVLLDVNKADSVIEKINRNEYKRLLDNQIIADGMLPKLNNCFHAIEQKVQKVCIGTPKMLSNKNVKCTSIANS
ncbi:acetylglutamate kinase [uncultured Marixanthomonas sp.]|uniref:acetylglutamate kinase n=1 Tax=uncultured Marixanthomonas sp. TaxID=757245 RepID=UPI0030D87D27|tara:strand:+ start:8220 stop:8999 length:780 start_codon:yes stop_codon:yes gene_type:complete